MVARGIQWWPELNSASLGRDCGKWEGALVSQVSSGCPDDAWIILS